MTLDEQSRVCCALETDSLTELSSYISADRLEGSSFVIKAIS